jgi:hypothetical protein
MAATMIAAVEDAGGAHFAKVMELVMVARPSHPPPAFNADPGGGLPGPTLRTKAKATGYRLVASRCDGQAISRGYRFWDFAN